MEKEQKSLDRWENPDCPEKYSRECYPPIGVTRLLPHHFRWWRRPFIQRWWWWWWRYDHCCCCCCCCCEHVSKPVADPERVCSIDLQLEANTFGPGRSIHIVVVPRPYQYFAEFYLTWTAVCAGQATVDLELISGPVPTPQLLADNRGPNDRYLFSTNQPGTYIFRATATCPQGNTCFDTLQVDLPRI